ncbi:hypothetical protein SI65_03866 [Aspergillus cristatus]|uniref:Phosphoglycerate mutase-like protein n=1 Tax=Aspergillus cristatus TaxID=573508 RepID=A0A1E3BIL2_ASPCR|nr:hypothetical protein SI65_03866 [Aspergillus cristatus]
MRPILYLVRHGQGEHNVNDSHHIRDPLLTEHGKKQCQDLRDQFQHHEAISLVLASPLKRAIQTAAHAFPPVLERRQVPSSCLVRDASGLITQGAPAFNVDDLDLTLVDEDWNSKVGIYAPTLNAVRRRVAAPRSWLWKRHEKSIVLVSHGAFLHYLTEDWTGYDRARGTGYMNCEYRQYEFSDCSTAEDAHLVEIGVCREKVDRPAGLDAHVIHEIEEVEKASA